MAFTFQDLDDRPRGSCRLCTHRSIGAASRRALDALIVDQLHASRRDHRGHLVVLVGLSYSGKSTLAAALIEDGFAHLSVTVLRAATGMGIDQVLSEFPRLVTPALRSGAYVLIDQVNYTKSSRKRLYWMAEEADANLSVIYLDESLEERRARRDRGGGTDDRLKGRRFVGDAELERQMRRFEPPLDEGALALSGSPHEILLAARAHVGRSLR